MKRGNFLGVVACAALGLVVAGSAQAVIISGTLFHVTEAQAQNAQLGLAPPASNVTFTISGGGASGLEFSFGVDNPPSVTVAAFLASASPAISPAGGTANGGFNTGDLMDTCQGWPTGPAIDNNCTNGGSNIGTYVVFTGSAFFVTGESFTIAHDDGLIFQIAGLTLPGFSTGPVNVPSETAIYTGATGNFPFTIVYAECCDGGARLNISAAVPSVPEPATLGLLGLGLSALAMTRRRKQSR